MIQVIAPGPLTLIQDAGRPGRAALGVGPSGAADARAFALANRLVGNPEGLAALELTFGGLRVRFDRFGIAAVCGAPCPVSINDLAASMASPLYLDRGDVLEVGAPTLGVRTYVAVRGGILAAPVLGSCSTDLLSGVGPPPVAAGARLSVGIPSGRWPAVDHAPVPPIASEPVLRVLPGPRPAWFAPDVLDTLRARRYRVERDSNRVAVRLRGERLDRAIDDELPSEGLVAGAVQVPPDGQPLLFLADHPVTGGYPVVAVVLAEDLPLAAQLRPGQRVRFARA
jgi:biotin-dependent carboxylase-like uncharacterized protein